MSKGKGKKGLGINDWIGAHGTAYSNMTTDQLNTALANFSKGGKYYGNKDASAKAAYVRGLVANANPEDKDASGSNGVDYINSQYDNLASNLTGSLTKTANNSVDEQNANSDSALKSSYVNYMTGKKDLNNTLLKQGLTGGASETANLKANTNFENSQTSTENTRANAINKIRQQLSADIESGTSDLSQARLSAIVTQMQNDKTNAYNDATLAETKKNDANSAKNAAVNRAATTQESFQNRIKSSGVAACNKAIANLKAKISNAKKKGMSTATYRMQLACWRNQLDFAKTNKIK